VLLFSIVRPISIIITPATRTGQSGYRWEKNYYYYYCKYRYTYN